MDDAGDSDMPAEHRGTREKARAWAKLCFGERKILLGEKKIAIPWVTAQLQAWGITKVDWMTQIVEEEVDRAERMANATGKTIPTAAKSKTVAATSPAPSHAQKAGVNKRGKRSNRSKRAKGSAPKGPDEIQKLKARVIELEKTLASLQRGNQQVRAASLRILTRVSPNRKLTLPHHGNSDENLARKHRVSLLRTPHIWCSVRWCLSSTGSISRGDFASAFHTPHRSPQRQIRISPYLRVEKCRLERSACSGSIICFNIPSQLRFVVELIHDAYLPDITKPSRHCGEDWYSRTVMRLIGESSSVCLLCLSGERRGNYTLLSGMQARLKEKQELHDGYKMWFSSGARNYALTCVVKSTSHGNGSISDFGRKAH
nr:hypothetical protein CFP56_24265 [Quercus suber]